MHQLQISILMLISFRPIHIKFILFLTLISSDLVHQKLPIAVTC